MRGARLLLPGVPWPVGGSVLGLSRNDRHRLFAVIRSGSFPAFCNTCVPPRDSFA